MAPSPWRSTRMKLPEYTIEPPWQYANTPSIQELRGHGDEVSSALLNVAAGLDWRVYQTPTFIYAGGAAVATTDEMGYVVEPHISRGFKLVGTSRGSKAVRVPDFYANVRDDTHDVLGLVKQRYRLVQNADAPAVLDAVVEGGAGRLVSAAALHGGSQVWWLARLTDPLHFGGDAAEALHIFLLLVNSHDGSTSLALRVVPLRVSSQTVLAWSLPGAQKSMQLRHTDFAKENAFLARKVLEFAKGYADRLNDVAIGMLERQLSEGEFHRFIDAVLPTPARRVRAGRVLNQRGVTMAENAKRAIAHVYLHEQTQQGIKGTLWGAVHACEFYSSYLSINRNTPDTSAAENRFKRLMTGQTLGAAALTHAMKMLRST